MATNFEFYIDALIETLKAKDQENCSGRTAQVTLCMEETDAYTCCKKRRNTEHVPFIVINLKSFHINRIEAVYVKG